MATNDDRKGTGKKPASDAGKLVRDPKIGEPGATPPPVRRTTIRRPGS